MMITRHNYEEFFILYMDNELTAEQRRQVESFVSLHPDLREELDTLLQFRLQPDPEIVYAGKSELLREISEGPINSINYEEWLLNYIDNELSEEERQMVDSFIAGWPPAADQLQLLLQSKLSPEKIVYEHKSDLYRRERRRIAPLWYRMAAAVLLLAIGLTAVIVLRGKQKEPGTLAGRGQVPHPAVTVKSPGKQADLNEVKDEQKDDELTAQNDLPKADGIDHKNTISKKELVAETKFAHNPKAIQKGQHFPDDAGTFLKNEAVVVVKDKPQTNNLPVPVINNTGTSELRNAIASADNTRQNNNLRPGDPVSVTSPNLQPSDYRTASFQPASDNTIDEGSGKKSKLRGFFRKITRTFEKRTNIDATTDDNKLLVAGWSINLK
jgi:hypothetical protein